MTYNIPSRRKFLPKRIFIAIPSRTDSVKVQTMMCIQDASVDAKIRDWYFEIHGYAGIEPISDCRNYILAEFLASGCDELVFWDDDIACERGALMRLLDHPVDFVIGVYRHRVDPESYPVRVLGERVESDPDTGLIEINGGGFGFARITRRCAEMMVKAYASLAYKLQGAPNDKAWMLFQLNVMGPDGQLSEDMIFAKRWNDIGGKMWADPEITFVHIGNKGFVGHYGDYLRRKMVEVEQMTQSAA